MHLLVHGLRRTESRSVRVSHYIGLDVRLSMIETWFRIGVRFIWPGVGFNRIHLDWANGLKKV